MDECGSIRSVWNKIWGLFPAPSWTYVMIKAVIHFAVFHAWKVPLEIKFDLKGTRGPTWNQEGLHIEVVGERMNM